MVAGVDETDRGQVDGCELSDSQVDKVDDVLGELMVEVRVGDLSADDVLKGGGQVAKEDLSRQL